MSATDPKALLLGQSVAYVDRYDASLLHPIPRAWNRAQLPLAAGASLPFMGEDVWTGYELSWLTPKGKPQVALAEFRFPCDTPQLIESKSFKLYLNSFNNTIVADAGRLQETLARDLSAASGGTVQVRLFSPEQAGALAGFAAPASHCLDDLDVTISHYALQPDLLKDCALGERVEECLHSHLLRSNCPVTGQPDWASVWVDYRGPRVRPEALLAYLVSFRNHAEFHEHCVERIFCDVWQHARPERLSVYARYTRRGGLDINPFRSSDAASAPIWRTVRQ